MNPLQTYELGVHQIILINLQKQWYINENGLQPLPEWTQERNWESFAAGNVPTA
jgi:hypothetical protein